MKIAFLIGAGRFPSGRRRGKERAGVSGRAERIRQLRRLLVAVRGWPATAESPARRTRDSATTVESDAFSRDLKDRGFTFVGSTVIYAHMQAVGMVNDHLLDCFRYRDILRLVPART
jgi:3-methyladenine DNA glycosylase Tag